jgi:hypothetical protein
MKPPKHPLAIPSVPKEGVGFGKQYQHVSPEQEGKAHRQAALDRSDAMMSSFAKRATDVRKSVGKRTRMLQVIADYSRRHDVPNEGGRKRKTRRRVHTNGKRTTTRSAKST